MAASRSATALTIHPSELSTYHRNPRRGDVSVIAASLQAHGQYKPIVVNRGTYTGRANEVLAGNHTLMAVRDLAERYPDDARWQQVLVHWVDVDDDRAARIVLVDNRASEVGGFDTADLASLLDSVGTDLTGLGFSADDVSDLHALLEERDQAPWVTGEDVPPPPAPRLGSDGLISSKDVVEQRESYADKSTRMVILVMPIMHFVWAQERLEEYRKEHGLDTNSDAVVRLLADWSGSVPPDGAIGAEDPEG